MDQPHSFYPGNRELPAEVRERVLDTFRQAVELQKNGRLEEVAAGCDLILKMDPQFAPAKKLLEKALNPTGVGEGGVFRPEELVNAGREALRVRDFARAIELSSEVLRLDLTNEDAQDISREAQEKMEAAPFAEQFLSKSQMLLDKGHVQAAAAELEKARSLDPEHPRLRTLENALAAAAKPIDLGASAKTSYPAAVQAPSRNITATVRPSPAPITSPSPAATTSPPSGTTSPPASATPAFDFGSPSDNSLSFDFQPDPVQPAGSGSSFIVETPAVTDGRTAQASDFGFSFAEEDNPISFDAPAKTSKPADAVLFEHGSLGEAQTFDFTGAVVETSPEDRARIDGFLREGDEAFSRSEFTKATDIWSRIFLIDVTNHPASERIEAARKKQMELESKIEDALTAGTIAHERNDLKVAKAHFEEVLRLDPEHQAAKEFMSRLGGVEATTPYVEEMPTEAEGIPLPPPPPKDADFGDDIFGEEFQPSPQTIVPPDGSAERVAARAPAVTHGPSVSTVSATPAKRRLVPMLILLGALAILGGAGYFGYRILTGEEKTTDPTQSALLVTRAQALARVGKYDEAIGILSTVNATDPQHDRALNLIADYRNKKSAKPALIDGRPAVEVFNELLTTGRAAFEARNYLGARSAFTRAASIQALPPEARQQLDTATSELDKLKVAEGLLKQGNYVGALQNLETLAQQDPGNPNILKLISDAHFNLGVTALRENRFTDAVAEFDKVLQTAPDDEQARRSREIAQKYNTEPKDLLLQIYVKYLPVR